jgi:hypothetical protein
MDPEIKKELLRQKAARIEMVKKEMAWEAAKHDLSLRKLQSRYSSMLMPRVGPVSQIFSFISPCFSYAPFSFLEIKPGVG